MKRVINGLIYNTETATEICEIKRRYGDFSDHTTKLYRTNRGRYFLSGSGGPRSRWAESCGQNSWSGGSGLVPVTDDEALEFAERAELDPDAIRAAGFAVDEA